MIEINNKKLCESCFSEINSEICPCCGFHKAEFTPDPTVLPMGTRLNDKIVIGRVMGKGGFGITYLAYDLRMDKTIAVKEYYPNGISYRTPSGTDVTVADNKSVETFEKGAEKFYTEAEMVSQFNGNPHIVSVYDYFRANHTVYLVMEYLSGITLKNYVKKHGRLTDGQALYVMEKIVAALSITHSAGVLHRDISPDNIMICSDGKVKLIDFGAARQILTESSSNLTVVMKPGYTPIEQYTKKGRQGAWTDIYSLGVSIYYALTKVVIDDPYARMDNDEEFAENKYGINESIWTILKKCTMINAAERYGSAIDLRKALKSVSAPLTAEAIRLSEDDLKEEPEETENRAASDGDFPATVLGDTAAAEEEIEKFETSEEEIEKFETSEEGVEKVETPGEETGKFGTSEGETGKSGTSGTSGEHGTTKNSAPSLEEKRSSRRKSKSEQKPSTKSENKKKGRMAGICAAAAFVIVIAVCVIVGINRRGGTSRDDGTVYSSVYPEMIDGKLNFELDSEYVGDWNSGREISRDNFLRFDGDVKVTLNFERCYELVSDTECPALLAIKDRNDQWMEVTAFNNGCEGQQDSDEVREYFMWPPQSSFSFVISREAAEAMAGGMKINVYGLIIHSAVLEAYDPAEFEPGADAVAVRINSHGDGETLSNYIPKEMLEAVGGDARVTLDIQYEAADPGFPNASIIPCTEKREYLHIEVENNTVPSWDADGVFYMLGAYFVPDRFTFTISSEEIEKLGVNGLCFEFNNLFIQTAYIEKE